SALLAALEEAVGDTVDPRDTVHHAGEPTDQRQRAEEARRRDRGDHEHADRLVGVSVDQLPEPGHHRAARSGDHARNIVTPAAPRFDQRVAHTLVMTWTGAKPRSDRSRAEQRAWENAHTRIAVGCYADGRSEPRGGAEHEQQIVRLVVALVDRVERLLVVPE